MYKWIQPVLFLFDAESIHHVVMKLARLLLGLGFVRAMIRPFYRVQAPCLEQKLFSVQFPNPVGLAAGFDKNAESINELATFGFAAIEIGTVTGEPQRGNDRPRLFRLPKDRALLNRMGFNNAGSDAIARRLARYQPEAVLGVNIGKSKVVALENATADYEKTFRALYFAAEYFVVNVSSPNTPGLRSLQGKEPLTELLSRLQDVNDELAAERGTERKPILLKIAPDLTFEQVDDVLSVIETCRLDGIVATNTTIDRTQLQHSSADDLGAGGLSGGPVRTRSLDVIRHIYRQTDGGLPIIGVGGIFSPEEALETLEAGASLLQVWTGFVYEGPGLVQRINRHLALECDRRDLRSVSDLVGASVSAEA